MNNYVPNTKHTPFVQLKKETMAKFNVDSIDRKILPHVNRINLLDNFCTIYSCEGHGNEKPYVAIYTDISISRIFDMCSHLYLIHDVNITTAICGIDMCIEFCEMAYAFTLDELSEMYVLIDHMESLGKELVK